MSQTLSQLRKAAYDRLMGNFKTWMNDRGNFGYRNETELFLDCNILPQFEQNRMFDLIFNDVFFTDFIEAFVTRNEKFSPFLEKLAEAEVQLISNIKPDGMEEKFLEER